MNTHQQAACQFGMIGLGTMGRNLLLNMADHGFTVTGYDKNEKMLQLLEKEGEAHQLKGFNELSSFIENLERPRKLILLVPAGPIVDQVIDELLPFLNEGDIIIDSGNSYFMDTTRRAGQLRKTGIHFFGMGISGGEEGARFGPSLMPGGDKEAYQAVQQMLEAVAAKVNGKPCVGYIGPGASGHFVKMTHNGIEYAIMQLLAETYEILKRGFGYNNRQIQQLFEKWNRGHLQSFLIEITQEIFNYKDQKTGELLIDLIKDEASSKGTGKWTSQVAMDLEVPIPTIDAAVSARNLSKLKALRTSLSTSLDINKEPNQPMNDIDALESAYYVAMAAAYAQGMQLLAVASDYYKYELKLAEIAKIWRGGCIIRAAFLEDIYHAYKQEPQLVHLFKDPGISRKINENMEGFRKIISEAVNNGLPVPAYASALAYVDTLRTERLASNLIQAQRDFFGAHTYQRIDEEGIFHSDWTAKTNH